MIKPPGIRQTIEHLESVYGRPEWAPRYEPLDELISCILTQHSTDASAYPAFHQLLEALPAWQQVVDAGPERVANLIRKAGLANQKAKSIIACLVAIRAENGDYTLDPLRSKPMAEAMEWLMKLPGVGPKTASIVCSFSLGMPAIPVDTHVSRVCRRLGWVPPKISDDKAHWLLLETVPPDLAYRFHVALIQHGRRVCKAPRPKCGECVIAASCPSYALLRSEALPSRDQNR